MYHSAIVSLGTQAASSPEEELQTGPEAFLASLQRTSTKSFLLSPFTFTRSFSPATWTLLQAGEGEDGAVSPLDHPSSQSLGNSHQDFTGLLPTEMMVHIFLYLDPQDLCSVSAVCKRWHQLTQCNELAMTLKAYVQCRREEYQLSKENYTPIIPSRAPVTTSPCPLGQIQPLSPLLSTSSQQNSQPPSPSIRESPRSLISSPTLTQLPRLSLYTPPRPPSPQWRSHTPTPSPSFLVDDVKFLSLDDNYQSLSPDLRWVESMLYSVRQAANSRKNKSRLRRL